MGYKIIYSRQAQKDARLLEQCNLDKKAKKLLSIIRKNPFQNPPPYEKLVGNMAGVYSRRINIQNRLIYQVKDNTVRVLRMWTHYE